MLTRIISAVVAAAIGITVIIFADTAALPAAVALLSMLGVFELYRAAGCHENKFMTAIALAFSGVYPFLVLYGSDRIILLVTTAVI
ncbi:MAG: hypothetical protein IKM72_12690, partial [Oscillospiraceae bacterium]|nr:hypothetical protein [Oscillospiraceae bacterium]